MAFPTLACKVDTLYIAAWGSTRPALTQFNDIEVLDVNGTWSGTFRCNPDLSAFLPTISRDPLSSSEFTELWPLLVLMFITAFGVRKLRQIFHYGV